MPYLASISEESRQRQGIAREIGDALARHDDGEVCITGSVARGVADRFSDLELPVLVEPPPYNVRTQQQRIAEAGHPERYLSQVED